MAPPECCKVRLGWLDLTTRLLQCFITVWRAGSPAGQHKYIYMNPALQTTALSRCGLEIRRNIDREKHYFHIYFVFFPTRLVLVSLLWSQYPQRGFVEMLKFKLARFVSVTAQWHGTLGNEIHNQSWEVVFCFSCIVHYFNRNCTQFEEKNSSRIPINMQYL